MPKTSRGGKRGSGSSAKPAYDGKYEKYYTLDFVKKYKDGFMTFKLNPQAIMDAAQNGDIKANLAMTMRMNSLNQYYGQDRNREKRQETGEHYASTFKNYLGDFTYKIKGKKYKDISEGAGILKAI